MLKCQSYIDWVSSDSLKYQFIIQISKLFVVDYLTYYYE